MKQIKGLDTLRAFAVFFVLFEHFGVWFTDDTAAARFFHYVIIPPGGLGVNLFFVLSGFLITGILLNAQTTGTPPGTVIKNFYIRRALRIFPIYYLLLLILCLIHYPDVRRYFWYFATYTSNILCYRTDSYNAYSHTWTLSVEEQFYLIWPWFIILTKRKYLHYVLFGAVFIGIFNPFFIWHVNKQVGAVLVYHSFDAFGLGGIFAWVLPSDKRTKIFTRTMKILVLPALCIYFYWRWLYMDGRWFPGIFLIKPCQNIISMWLIILVVQNRSVLVRKYLLENRILNYLGRISYGLYLYHYPYRVYFHERVDAFVNRYTTGYPTISKLYNTHLINYWTHILIVVIVAAVSFQLIEKPLLRLKKKFGYNHGKRMQTS